MNQSTKQNQLHCQSHVIKTFSFLCYTLLFIICLGFFLDIGNVSVL